MSVIAAKKYENKIVVAADSQISYGGMNRKFPDVKMRKINSDLIIGVTGTAETCGLLWIYFETHSLEPASCEKTIMNFITDFVRWRKDYAGGDSFDSSFIIVYKDKIFEVFGFSIIEITDYVAIGSGFEMATAALYLGHSPKEAVKVACDLTNYVGEPIKEEVIKFNAKK